MGDDGAMRVYSDQDVTASAAYLQRDTARLKELEPLLKQAKAELAATVKVAKAA
jgi:hypothetical protein